MLSYPWPCLGLTSLVAEQLRKPRVREVTSSTQSYGWWQSRARAGAQPQPRSGPRVSRGGPGCSWAWVPASLHKPISATAVAPALSPLGGALTCGLSVLCVLEPWPPDHQNVLKDLGSLAEPFCPCPAPAAHTGPCSAPPHRGRGGPRLWLLPDSLPLRPRPASLAFCAGRS